MQKNITLKNLIQKQFLINLLTFMIYFRIQ